MINNENNQENKPDKQANFPTISLPDSSAVVGGEIGPYKLLSVLGEGGFGIVYLAEQKHPVKRTVALKIIKPGMDTKQVIARFEAERQALALLEHPNIARVYNAGSTEAGRPYFVMEYIKGMPITEHCDQHQLNIKQRLKLFIQVCEAVQHAHQKGIIHRDIKPSNIVVDIIDGKPVPKIIDFGVAKAISMPLTEKTMFTQQGQLIGTPEYMSPEQADLREKDIDTRTDIYSLGVVLYELLAGTLPFEPKTLREGGYAEIQRIIREQEPPRPSTKLSSLGNNATKAAQSRRIKLSSLINDLHQELEWIPLKAIRKDRDQRYKTASDLAEDIQNYLDGNPLVAGPESMGYKVSKFVKRNRVYVIAGSLILLILIAGIIISTYFGIGQYQARREAEAAKGIAEEAQKKAETSEKNALQERKEKEEEAIRARQAQELAEREAYRATIQNIWAKLNTEDHRGIRKMLEDTDPKLRGWEWGYLMNLCQKPNWTLEQQNIEWPYALATSSDGNLMVTSLYNKFVLWDIKRKTAIWESQLSNQKELIFDPIGNYIVGIFNDQIHVCDIESGKSLRSSEREQFESLCIDPNGKWIYTGTREGKILKLDFNNLQVQNSCVFSGYKIQHLAVNSNGQQIACALIPSSGDEGLHNYIYIVNPETLTVDAQIRPPYYGHIRDMIIIPASDTLLCIKGSIIRVYSLETLEEIESMRYSHARNFSSLSVSKDYQYIAAGNHDGIANIYSAKDFKLLKTLYHDSAVLNIAFGADNSILTLGEKGVIKQWDLINEMKHGGFTVVPNPSDQPEGPYRVAFRTDSKMVAFSGWGFDTILLYKMKTRNISNLHSEGFEEIPRENRRIMTFRPNSFELVTCTPEYLRFHDTDQADYPEIRSIPIRGFIHDIAFDSSGLKVAVSYDDGKVELIDVQTSGFVRIDGLGENFSKSKVEFCPDGSSLLVMEQFNPGRILMIEIKEKRLLWKTSTSSHSHLRNGLAFHPKGKVFLIGLGNGNIEVWDCANGKHLSTLLAHNSDVVDCIKFNQDGSRFLSGSCDNTLRIWDWQLRKQLLVIQQEWAVLDSDFSPDGMSVVSTTYGKNAGYVRTALPWTKGNLEDFDPEAMAFAENH